MARTCWQKNDVDSDKIVLFNGQKYLSTSLTGEKGVITILGSVDKNVTLLGDKSTNLFGDTNKDVALLGTKGVTSLIGTKNISSLLGAADKTPYLLGEGRYLYLEIHTDTSYVTCDFTDITVDRL